MKKASMILLVISIALCLAGCSGAAKSKTVTVWCWDPNFNGYSMKEAAAVYSAKNPKTVIEVVDIPENIEGKIEAGLQAGGAGLPDIALFQDFIIEKFIQNYPGAFVDLKAAGVDGLSYIKGAPLLGTAAEATVAASPPTDLGMVRMADAREPLLRPML